MLLPACHLLQQYYTNKANAKERIEWYLNNAEKKEIDSISKKLGYNINDISNNFEFSADDIKVLDKLNIQNKIIEQTDIKEITNNKLIKDFLNKNHLQGYMNSTIKIGLFYEKELVSLMIFKKLKNNYKLLIFCNKLNTNIINSESKLFNYFIKTYTPKEVITYVDRSYSNGKLYEQLGFKLHSKTKPNCYYIINGTKKYNKIPNCNSPRIYDSGNIKLVFIKQTTNS